jgi:hypothetical protein
MLQIGPAPIKLVGVEEDCHPDMFEALKSPLGLFFRMYRAVRAWSMASCETHEVKAISLKVDKRIILCLFGENQNFPET